MKKSIFSLFFGVVTLFSHECSYDLQLYFDIQKGILTGDAKIKTDHDSVALLDTSANITSIENARLIVKESRPYLLKEGKKEPVDIKFIYKFAPGSKSVVLLSKWYPAIDLLCDYEILVKNPKLPVVTETTEAEKREEGTLYRYRYPLDRAHIVISSDYNISSYHADSGIDIFTYLYPQHSSLSDLYLKLSGEYFSKYKRVFGFIPFKRFSIAETPFPAGYSMATFTLIGRQIIDKPFVLNSSLGHEIVHQWFGNYVYAPARGNWTEGLTTYYADYMYAKERGEDVRFRKDLLLKYNSYVNRTNEIALIEFTSKNRESKNAIGYGKSAFFFHMLEKKIGKDAFKKGVENLLEKYPFKIAGYSDLRKIFEESSGMKLMDFFKTWVYRKGAFKFDISNIRLKFVDDRYELSFDIHSNNMLSRLPLKVCSKNECLWETIDLRNPHQKLELDIEPKKIIIDENYEIFRHLQPDEIPPVIYRILKGDVTVVVDRKDRQRFSKMLQVFKNVVLSDDIKFDAIKTKDILVLGADNSFLRQVAITFSMEGDTKIELFKNPLNRSHIIAVFESRKLSPDIFYRLKHLGKYSTVVMKDGKIVKKETRPSQKGAQFKIGSGSYALKPSLDPIEAIFPDLTKHKVVFIGEQHNKFSNHLNQLKIIKAMVKAGKKVAIGMEMFQEPYQKYLTEFIEGKISEKEMLKKTEYFKRWKYNYHLYRPIILYAKKEHLPLIALNIEKEITKKVVRKGIDSLNKKEKNSVPKSIDFSNSEYKNELRNIFSSHQSQNFKNFDEFYYAQLLWDETMAKNIVKYLQKNPDRSMVVLAGNGHVMFGFGIPDRIERRGIKDYRIVVNSMKPKPGIADYLLYPEPIETAKEKKIGVYLEADDKLKVSKLVEDSPAKKSGIRKDDVIIAIDGIKVKTISDLKLELFFTGKKSVVTVVRNGTEVEIPIIFGQKD